MDDSGLYGKFLVERHDGVWEPDARYFVLNYASDPHARTALRAYADACETTHPHLAAELRATADYHDDRVTEAVAGRCVAA